jgi:hypothetical protein
MRSPRSRFLFAAAAAVLALVAAPGAGAQPARETAVVPPQEKFTAADMRRAKVSLVRLRDLVHTFRNDPEGLAVPRIVHCDGYPGDRSSITLTAYAKSSFTDGFNGIGSSSIYFKTPVDLAAYWKKTVVMQYAKCLARHWVFANRGRARTISVKEVPLGPTGAHFSKAYRVLTRVKTRDGKRTFNWYETVAFVGWGRALSMASIQYAHIPCDCHPGIAQDLMRRIVIASR